MIFQSAAEASILFVKGQCGRFVYQNSFERSMLDNAWL